MKVFYKFSIILLISIFLGSCAVHHPYARARPKAGKKKSCNCPDFGYNSPKPASETYFYIHAFELKNKTD
jgi:hypothetical protein